VSTASRNSLGTRSDAVLQHASSSPSTRRRTGRLAIEWLGGHRRPRSVSPTRLTPRCRAGSAGPS
jgi:hypothetical protein